MDFFFPKSLACFACEISHMLCSAWPIHDLPLASLHLFSSLTVSWSVFLGFCISLKYALTCSMDSCHRGRFVACFHRWQIRWVAHDLSGCVFCCSQNDSPGFVFHSIDFQQAELCAGLWDPDHSQWRWVSLCSNSRNRWRCWMSSAAMDFRADNLLLVRSACCTWAFCRSGARGTLDCSYVLWLLHWRRLLAVLVPLLCCLGCATGLVPCLEWFRTVSRHHCDTFFRLLLDSGDCCVDVTGWFVDKHFVCKCKHSAEAIAVQICQFLCVHIVQAWGQGKALWMSSCQWFRGEDLVSEWHGDLSFLKCFCEPFCERQAYTMFYMEFPVVRIFQIDFFFPLESFAHIVCESGCVFSSEQSCCVPPGMTEIRFSFLDPEHADMQTLQENVAWGLCRDQAIAFKVLLHSQLCRWGSSFWVRFLRMWPFLIQPLMLWRLFISNSLTR